MSPVFITAIQFSKCAPLVGGNFIIACIPEFVKHFFNLFFDRIFRCLLLKRLPSRGRLFDYITSESVCQVLFLIFSKLFSSPCRSLATDAILTHTPHFVNTFFDKLFYKTPPLKKAAFVHFKLSDYLSL